MSHTETRDTCGTYAGAQAHIARGEKKCDPCRVAYNKYEQDYRVRNPKVLERQTKLARIKRRTLLELAERYPVDYQNIYNEMAIKENT